MRTKRAGVAAAAAVLLLSAPASAAAGSLLDPIVKRAPSPSPSPTSATATVTVETESTASSSGGLAISVPSAVSLGSRPVGAGTITGRLGTVQVTTSGGGLVGSTGWLTKVSTSGFRSDTDPTQVIAPGAVSYSAGAATGLSGVSLSACRPGAPVALAAEATAFSCSGLSLLTGTSVAWSPTLSIEVTADHRRGTYRGTITHSVA